ncbi:hypothetical protein [Jiangella alba]|uniref:hypothetical protein n=1 Tax=Jiangella alba TaxID=561176 RepID=UPI00114D062D|nr:hypothetical protein [Jiangella alba]
MTDRDITALTVECPVTRSALEETARRSANELIRTAQLASLESRWNWGLIAVSTIRPTNRLAAHLAERRTFWELAARAGTKLPPGERIEIDLGSSQRRAGEIALSLIDLPAAMDLTRTADMICIGFPPEAPHDQAITSIVDAMERSTESRWTTQFTLLRAATILLASGHLIMRSSGRFDDNVASSDLFFAEKHAKFDLYRAP